MWWSSDCQGKSRERVSQSWTVGRELATRWIFGWARWLLDATYMKTHRPRGARTRGVTLFEVLIVVAILAMVAGAVAVVAIGYFDRARIRMAETNARTVRAAVKGYWIENHTAECPTVQELVHEEVLDRDNASKDPWGTAWRIECNGRDVIVSSNGRDLLPGTGDDIRVPPT